MSDSNPNYDQNYDQQIQKHLDYIRMVSEACRQKCEQLKVDAEKQIAAINKPGSEDEIKVKVQLKKDLDKVVEEFEKEMRRSFINNLTELEEIYRQKELIAIAIIEKEFQTV